MPRVYLPSIQGQGEADGKTLPNPQRSGLGSFSDGISGSRSRLTRLLDRIQGRPRCGSSSQRNASWLRYLLLVCGSPQSPVVPLLSRLRAQLRLAMERASTPWRTHPRRHVVRCLAGYAARPIMVLSRGMACGSSHTRTYKRASGIGWGMAKVERKRRLGYTGTELTAWVWCATPCHRIRRASVGSTGLSTFWLPS